MILWLVIEYPRYDVLPLYGCECVCVCHTYDGKVFGMNINMNLVWFWPLSRDCWYFRKCFFSSKKNWENYVTLCDLFIAFYEICCMNGRCCSMHCRLPDENACCHAQAECFKWMECQFEVKAIDVRSQSYMAS